MPQELVSYLSFNRGIISPLAQGRIDLKRTSISASTMENWIPRTLGSMMLRPGTKYIATVNSSGTGGFYIPFIFSHDDKAIIEISGDYMRVIIDDEVVTRPSVSSSVTNADFTTDLSSWTDNDEAGATSQWVTSGGEGYMELQGDGTAYAIRDQTVTVAVADRGVVHALYVIIAYGPVHFSVGSTTGGVDYIADTVLDTGYYSMAFTPTGNFSIRFKSNTKYGTWVDYCQVEPAGDMEIDAPWTFSYYEFIKYDQSGDVIYVSCVDYEGRKIIRYDTESWGIARYRPTDGPFRLINTSSITITPSALSGDVTLTASESIFDLDHVRGLFRITSEGQTVSSSLTAENTFTNAIRVTGVDTSRVFTITRSGTWTATITLQRSFTSDTGPWEAVTTYTTNATVSYDDTFDNQIVWYRIGIETGDYTSGTAVLTLDFPLGSITGICRITGYSSGTSVTAEVLTDFGGTDATPDWEEGEWSFYRQYPTSVALHEGRLFWSGQNGLWGSVSDAYESFDDTVEGDSGTISKTIGSGPVDSVNYLLSLDRLIVGTDGSEVVVKSSSLDEPLTPTNCSLKRTSTHGSFHATYAIAYDKAGIYVQRGGRRVMLISLENDGNYGSRDLTLLCPEIVTDYVYRLAIQRQPDTRIHAVLSDGTVCIGVIDQHENVLGWCKYETDGLVEDVIVLPGNEGDNEDHVYYMVHRSINGSTVHYLEKWSFESECVGGTLNKQLDSFILYSGASTTTITGLGHLEGETVGVWGNGAYLGTYTVSSSQITGLSSAVTSAVVGLIYTAQWKSTKLGTALGMRKKVDHLGLLMQNVHSSGLQYGPDFNTLYDLPGIENGTTASTITSEYDEDSIEFPGQWDNDSRICLQAVAPKPCTVISMIAPIMTNVKT